MTSKRILFVINYLDDSSIPIEIIEKVADYLDDRFRIYVMALFRDVNYAEKSKKLMADAGNIELVRLRFKNRNDLIFRNKALRKYVGNLAPDIIHTNHKYSSLFLFHKILNRNTKFIHTMHSDYNFFDKLSKIEMAATFRFYDYIIHNSRNTRSSWPSYYRIFRRPQELVIYNGLNLKKADEAKPNRLMKGGGENEKLKIMIAARFVNQKNIMLALRAVKELVRKGYDKFVLNLVGGGHLLPEYKAFVDRNGLSPVVNFVGFLERDQVYKMMWDSDIYLITSLYEGFCNAAIEAMYTENILLSSDIEPLKSEVIGENGVFFKNDNLFDLVNKLIDILDNVSIYKRKKVFLKKRVKKNFSLEATAESYAKVYQRILVHDDMKNLF